MLMPSQNIHPKYPTTESDYFEVRGWCWCVVGGGERTEV